MYKDCFGPFKPTNLRLFICQLVCLFLSRWNIQLRRPPSDALPPSAPYMSQSGVVRKKSLRIPSQQPLQAPIPPSLLQSPHLNSPQSIFRRALSPRVPSIDDEWLQDTVPQHGAVRPPQQETKHAQEQGSRRGS
ncbi:hypothetical protein B0H17DRAFT_1057990 [Mycena rosella]|uniref:Uncharacterized protein n=1 Tax=Mycena rosella TaxID=1033263 RepID=A0AAD7DN44_MYCRO|nr:hypothetical protein B0H17DRAFT_1057990 [Mycena rosella]